MRNLIDVIRRNRLAVAIWLALLVTGAALFGLAIGLSPGVAVGLWAVAFAISLGFYRWFNKGPIRWEQPLARSRVLLATVTGVVVTGLLIQAVPFGWDRSNPPVTAEPTWDSPRTRELVVRACFDCHSNEVDYPWYARVAPMSWAVQLHVSGARGEVNYSEWDRPQDEADESAETVRDGEMPPRYYTWIHSEAQLSDAEIDELVAGLEATFGAEERDGD